MAENFDYEEVNLSIARRRTRLIVAAGADRRAATWPGRSNSGAAGRSLLRRKQQLRPRSEVKIKVNPPPLQTLDTGAGTMVGAALGGRAAQSFWHAQDEALAAGARRRSGRGVRDELLTKEREMPIAYQFLPWVRRGLTVALDAEDNLGNGRAARARQRADRRQAGRARTTAPRSRRCRCDCTARAT